MTHAASSELAKASLAGYQSASSYAVPPDKAVAPPHGAPNDGVSSGAALLDALHLGRSAPNQAAAPQHGARGVLVDVPAAARRQNPPEIVPPPPTPPIAIPLRVAISPVAADGNTSGATLAMRRVHALLVPVRA
jgi:hypothetical protein